MIVLALLLAAVPPTNVYEKDVCSERDNRAECVRQVRLGYRRCGPEGYNDWDDVVGPVCERWGWDGHRYRPFCSGSKSHPRRNDPWLWSYLLAGETLRDAMIELSDNRVNTCDRSK